MKVLMIEDNESVVEMMEMFYKNENWEVVVATDGKEGLELFLENPKKFDVVTLDLNLPTMDGLQVAKRIREVNQTVSMIMLTARTSESDEVIGLGLGADEYVSKPFSPVTLIARIKALYRRSQTMQESWNASLKENLQRQDTILNYKEVCLDDDSRIVYVDGEVTERLTPKEFELLKILMRNADKILPRDTLLEMIWGEESFSHERSVDVYVKKIRQKLGENAQRYLQTSWGVGYYFGEKKII